MEKLFTVLYSFIASELGLKGLAKEVFAIIWGFWLDADRMPAWVSLNTMGKITGGSRPAIVEAIRLLENQHFISVDRNPGHHSMYTVTIDAKIIREYEELYAQNPVNQANHSDVKSHNNERESSVTRSSKATYPLKQQKNSMNQSNLYVHLKDEYDSCGLDEA